MSASGVYHTPWWKFWRPQSGVIGGLIMGAVVLAVIRAVIWLAVRA